MGYAVAAAVGYAIWLAGSKYWETDIVVLVIKEKWWRCAQWITTGWLWFTWLSHDMANIAVFLPRSIPVETMIIISIVLVICYFPYSLVYLLFFKKR